MKVISGIIKGFPIVNSLRQLISGEKKINEKGETVNSFNAKEFFCEVSTVCVILGFISGKINIEDVKTLFGLLK